MKLDTMFDAPNGILLSPDERSCYVSDVWNDEWRNSAVTLDEAAIETSEAKKVLLPLHFGRDSG